MRLAIPKCHFVLFIVVFLMTFFSQTTYAKEHHQLTVSYIQGSNKSELKIEKWLKQSPEIKLITDLVNQEFKLVEPLSIVFGENDGPLFDSGINKIFIPYHFLVEVEQRFKQVKYTSNNEMTLKDAIMDALLHTIVHELAHALIFQFDLPVLGKEEDAADGLASMLLIEYLEEGQEIVITAADLFGLESQDVDEYQVEDYWDEHSLDIQRYYSSLCHVYGSSPEKYKHIKIDEKFSDEKSLNCQDDYEILVNSWLALLDPFLVNKS